VELLGRASWPESDALGGRVVIQANRHKDAEAVSTIEDLCGTMINEGANKGTLVTTSRFGRDAHNFAEDCPIELVDGGLLSQLAMRVKAHIVFPED